MIAEIQKLVTAMEELPLRVRLYRLFTFTAAVMCLLIVLPINAVLPVPPQISTAALILGVSSVAFLAASWRGRDFYYLFLVLLVGTIDVVWFFDAGSQGSMSLY